VESSKISSGNSIPRSQGFFAAPLALNLRGLPLSPLREEEEEEGGGSSCFFSAFPRSIVGSEGGPKVRR